MKTSKLTVVLFFSITLSFFSINSSATSGEYRCENVNVKKIKKNSWFVSEDCSYFPLDSVCTIQG